MALTRKNLLNISRLLSQIESSSELSTIFKLSFSSQTEEDKDKDRDIKQRMGRKLSEEEGDDVSSVESKIKRDKGRYDDEDTIMKSPEDEDELKSKLEHNPGGKPVDQDQNLDVNWRPIDEKKSE